jgi:plasmid stabilization system protein ParE
LKYDVGYIYSYLHPDFVEIVVVRHGETTWNSLKKCQVQFYFIFKNLLQFCSLEFSSRLCYSIFNIIILSYPHPDYAKIVVVRHGQTIWNAERKVQVIFYFIFNENCFDYFVD